MKILIFGITGRTGRLVAREALKRGHEVVGIARDPDRVASEGAEIVTGTPFDYATVEKAIEGCDAVVSTLSTFSSSQGMFTRVTTPVDSMTVSIKNAVNLMKQRGLRRIVVMTARGAGDSKKGMPWSFRILLMISNLKYAYADHDNQEKLLEDSGLDWTIVRPVTLTDNNEDLSVTYKLKNNGKINAAISRNAVAHFIINCIEQGEFIREKPEISGI